MKKVEAIIRKSKFEVVKQALHDVDINFITYWDVTGEGNEKKETVYRGVSFKSSDIARRMISFVCNDDFKEAAINAIVDSAKTGEVGDGKIFVYNVEESVRIRNGERGSESLKEGR